MYMTEPYFFLKKDTLRWDFMFYLRYLFGILCGNWGENKAGGYSRYQHTYKYYQELS